MKVAANHFKKRCVCSKIKTNEMQKESIMIFRFSRKTRREDIHTFCLMIRMNERKQTKIYMIVDSNKKVTSTIFKYFCFVYML